MMMPDSVMLMYCVFQLAEQGHVSGSVANQLCSFSEPLANHTSFHGMQMTRNVLVCQFYCQIYI